LKQAEPLGTKTSIGTLPPKDGWEVAKKKVSHRLGLQPSKMCT